MFPILKGSFSTNRISVTQITVAHMDKVLSYFRFNNTLHWVLFVKLKNNFPRWKRYFMLGRKPIINCNTLFTAPDDFAWYTTHSLLVLHHRWNYCDQSRNACNHGMLKYLTGWGSDITKESSEFIRREDKQPGYFGYTHYKPAEKTQGHCAAHRTVSTHSKGKWMCNRWTPR